jgi:hypothetical protein
MTVAEILVVRVIMDKPAAMELVFVNPTVSEDNVETMVAVETLVVSALPLKLVKTDNVLELLSLTVEADNVETIELGEVVETAQQDKDAEEEFASATTTVTTETVVQQSKNQELTLDFALNELAVPAPTVTAVEHRVDAQFCHHAQ